MNTAFIRDKMQVLTTRADHRRPVGIHALTAAIMVAGALGLWLAGCTGVSDSLRLSNAVLVKIPCDGSKPSADSGHWHFQHALAGPREDGRINHWYVAWNDEQPDRKTFGVPYWSKVLDEAPAIATATWQAFHAEPLLVEPNHTFRFKAAAKPGSEPADPQRAARLAAGPSQVTYGASTTPAWPEVRGSIDPQTNKFLKDPVTQRDVIDPRRGPVKVDPFWYRDDAYSELESARMAAGRPLDGERIRIGHLDNGLDGDHPAAPPNLLRGQPWTNAVGLLTYAQELTKQRQSPRVGPAPTPLPTPVFPEKSRGTHGLGTIGLLAGGKVRLPEQSLQGVPVAAYTGYVGGAPEAEVVPMRIAPWVVSLSTAELAYAIDYASRVERCDVISMSHGGSPSQAWVDAVNAAYDRGTAMFAAESDFVSLSFDPLPVWGIVLPSSPVYPAAFRRVLGVTGVTADDTSYGRNRLDRLARAPQAVGDWAMRGSYGADGTSTVFFRPNAHPDGSELKRGGPLRPQPIAAYSPNVPWLAARYSQDGGPTRYVVDLNGAGTSAATPQVAAAAALWLQKHRHEFRADEWHGWQKPEAVYCALLSKAYLPGHPDRPDPFLGAGILKAKQSLDVNYAAVKHLQKPPEIPGGPAKRESGRALYFAKSGRDHFDAQRSFAALLGFDSLRDLPYDQRADLFQSPMAGAERTDALRRFFYNTLLLQAWQGGHLPDKDGGAEDLWIKAEQKVARSLSGYVPLTKERLKERVDRLYSRPLDIP